MLTVNTYRDPDPQCMFVYYACDNAALRLHTEAIAAILFLNPWQVHEVHES